MDLEKPTDPVAEKGEAGAALVVETYLAMGDEDGDFAPGIMVRVERNTPYNAVEKLADEELVALEKEFGVTMVRRDGSFLDNDAPTEEALLRWEVEGEELFIRKLYAICDDVAYTLTLTFRDSSGLGRHPQGEQLLGNFNPPEELRWE